MSQKMRIKRNLILIDVYTICMNMLFAFPVIIPYYRDQIGLSFQQFLLGEACFAATIILLDVPTGWLSDVWKRKHTQALGYFFLVIGYGCLLMAKGLATAITAQTVIGIGISLCNGTNTAILYESLLSAGREGEYRRREGRRQAMGFYTVGLSSIAGGLMYHWHRQLPFALIVLAMVSAMVASLLLDEPERHRKKPERHPIMDILATIKYALHGHREIGFIIIFAATMFCTTKLIMWSQQPYYMHLHIPEAWYGLLTAGSFLLGGASSHMAHLLDGKVSPYRVLAGLLCFAMLVCLGAAWSPGYHGVALLMMGGTCIYGMASPRVNEVINKHVDSARRATVLSTQSLLVSTLFIPLSSVMGMLSKHAGIQAVLLGLAAWLCLAGGMIGLLAVRRRRG